MTVSAVLRCADEHLDKIVVQRIVELPLETPFELCVIQVARMQFEGIRVNWNRGVLELDGDFNPVALCRR